MSNAQHTPGPWAIKETKSENFIGIGAEGHYSLADVWMIDDGVTREQMEANARLIAAAPELLEALELLTQWRDVIAKSELPAKSAILEDFDDARAAIAKATGD